MPVKKCPNGKYRIGSGPCQYSSQAEAARAMAAMYAQKGEKKEHKKES